MNDQQENKLTMFRAVAAVLTQYLSKFASLPALVAARQAFNASVSLIGELAKAQNAPTGGITLDKANLQEQMVETAFAVAGALRAFATTQNDMTLKAQVEINKSTFTKARDDMRDDIAQRIHDLAATHLAQLADYGITAATLTGFQTRIDAYVVAIAKPLTARAARTTVTTLLEAEVRRAESILEDRVDGLVEQFKNSGTNFYSDYQNARKNINTGSRGGEQTPPAPPTP